MQCIVALLQVLRRHRHALQWRCFVVWKVVHAFRHDCYAYSTHARTGYSYLLGYSRSTGWAKCRPIHSCQARCAVREAIKPLKRAISKMEAELFTLRNMR